MVTLYHPSGDGLIVMVLILVWVLKTLVTHAEYLGSVKYQLVYAPFGTTTDRSLL